MRLRTALLLSMTAVLTLLAACNTGPVRRVSEPAAAIQQLTVRPDGNWDVALRLQNYSSIPMRFDTLRMDVTVAGQPAGELRAAPALTIGPESADVLTVALQPSAAAKLAVADALSARRTITYSLSGDVTATPDASSARPFSLSRTSELSPAPGLPGVLR